MNRITEALSNQGFIPGRMISWSKSAYREKNPDNEVYFNANIFVIGDGKVWYGDIDLNKDEKVLQSIAKSTQTSLYILKEFDGRFGNENLTDSQIVSKSIKAYHP